MFELQNVLRKVFPNKSEKAEISTLDLKKKTAILLLTDRLSDEIKEMVKDSSGCGFTSVLQLLDFFGSPILRDRKKQQELINDFKQMFGSLTADLYPEDFVKFFNDFNLGVNITEFFYNIALGSKDDFINILSSNQKYELNFEVVPFRNELLNIELKLNQCAIIGVEHPNLHAGHYFLSDRSSLLTQFEGGGESVLKKYQDEGYYIAEVFIFERKK